jgi:hypothetical protein
MDRDIAAFLEHARQKGLDHATVRMLLLSSGWKEKDVAQAFTDHVLDFPIPAPPDAGSAREAFFHLLTFAAFYTAAISLTMLLFRLINHHLPDPAGQRTNARWDASRIRWQIAILLVAFPLFLWFSRFVTREMRKHPERAWSGVRRWLTYLTLFAASIALGCDVVALVYNLLEGELSSRFLAKVLVVLVVAGISLAYYLVALRLPAAAHATRRLNRTFATTASTIVGAAIVWGFVLAGSPQSARVLKLDDRRIGDLQGIVSAIEDISLETKYPVEGRKLGKPLPSSLEEVVAQAKLLRPSIVDPVTGEPYGYETIDASRYRLCATFEAARDEDAGVSWNHAAGRACFERDLLHP